MKRAAVTAIVMVMLALEAAHAAEIGLPSESVDLPAVLEIVRNVSPRLAVERESIAQAEADRLTAGAYPNPTLS